MSDTDVKKCHMMRYTHLEVSPAGCVSGAEVNSCRTSVYGHASSMHTALLDCQHLVREGSRIVFFQVNEVKLTFLKGKSTRETCHRHPLNHHLLTKLRSAA